MNKKLIIIAVVVILVVLAGLGIYMLTQKNSGGINLSTTNNLKAMIDTVYKNAGVELPYLETVEIDLADSDMVASYTYLSDNSNVEALVVSQPMMSSQAYSLVAFKLKDNANVEVAKQEVYDNANMSKWVCVTADKLYITNYKNVVFYIMASEEWAKPVYDSFKNYVENKVGKELEKIGTEEDIELPPEILAQ